MVLAMPASQEKMTKKIIAQSKQSQATKKAWRQLYVIIEDNKYFAYRQITLNGRAFTNIVTTTNFNNIKPGICLFFQAWTDIFCA